MTPRMARSIDGDAVGSAVAGVTARWVDAMGRGEEAWVLGPPDHQLVAILHTPAGDAPRGAVLMCSSLYEDLQLHYRRDLLIARELCARGFAVARFHYRGTGNSAPLSDGAVTMSSLVDDADEMLVWLRQQTGTARIALYADKVGALVAGELAALRPGLPLVLVGPVLSGADYFRSFVRASKVAGLRSRKSSQDARFDEQLAAQGFADVLGHTVHERSYVDLRRATFADLAEDAGPIVMIELTRAEKLAAKLQERVDRLRQRGVHVDTVLVRQREQWFVPDQWEPDDEVPDALVLSEAVAEWVEGRWT